MNRILSLCIITLGSSILVACATAPATLPPGVTSESFQFTTGHIGANALTGNEQPDWKPGAQQALTTFTDTLLADLGAHDSMPPAAAVSAAQSADSKKFNATVAGTIASGIAAIVAGGSKWVIGGLSIIGGIGTLLVSRYGTQEAACSSTAQTVLDIQQFKLTWTNNINNATSSTDSIMSGYTDAAKSLSQEVGTVLTGCPEAVQSGS